MSEPFVGEIRIFGFNFAPQGWAFCQGQLLPIAQNTALFSLLGTTYGGNGISTFALPNLQGRVPVHQGQGAGLSPYNLGQSGGASTVTLAATQMPAHSHGVQCLAGGGNVNTPVNNGFAEVTAGRGVVNLYAATSDGTTMNTAALSSVGGGGAHNNMAPFLGVSFCIALQGIFPSRN
jgi:microcystin-dependent protein